MVNLDGLDDIIASATPTPVPETVVEWIVHEKFYIYSCAIQGAVGLLLLALLWLYLPKSFRIGRYTRMPWAIPGFVVLQMLVLEIIRAAQDWKYDFANGSFPGLFVLLWKMFLFSLLWMVLYAIVHAIFHLAIGRYQPKQPLWNILAQFMLMFTAYQLLALGGQQLVNLIAQSPIRYLAGAGAYIGSALVMAILIGLMPFFRKQARRMCFNCRHYLRRDRGECETCGLVWERGSERIS
nr:hypothetical protein [bacterium]